MTYAFLILSLVALVAVYYFVGYFANARKVHTSSALIDSGGLGSVLGVGKVSATDHANVLGSNHMNDYRLGARILRRLHHIADLARAAWGSVMSYIRPSKGVISHRFGFVGRGDINFA